MHDIRRRFLILAVLSALSMPAAQAWAQQLTIQNDDGKRTVLSRADLEALPHVKVQATAHDVSAAFEGVAVKTVLEKAGIAFGEGMRGKRLASCLLVEAADGYKVVIALPEMDPGFTDKQVVLAFLKDGKAMDSKEGPYRIVIPNEKRPARWIRQVTGLKIVDVQ
jgi:hypothetical protein